MGPHTQTGCRENGSGQTRHTEYKDTDLFNVAVEGTSPDQYTIVDDTGTHHKQNHKPILVDIISYFQCVYVFYLFFLQTMEPLS